MKTPTKGMLQLDSIIQAVLIIPILIVYISSIYSGGFTIFLALMLQLILAVYQLGSALIRTVRHGSTFRKNYLTLAIGYVLVLIAGTTIVSSSLIGDNFMYFLGISGMIVIPMMMALFYWYRTIQQARGKFEEAVGFKKQKNLVNLAEGGDADDRVIEEIILRQKERIKK